MITGQREPCSYALHSSLHLVALSTLGLLMIVIYSRTIYNQYMTETFDELVGFRQIAGDIVVYDKDVEGHLAHVRQFLQRF